MNKINRQSFMKLGALALMAPLGNKLFAGKDLFSVFPSMPADDLMKRLVAANDDQVEHLVQTISRASFVYSRRIGSDFSVLAAAYGSPGSAYYQDHQLIGTLEILVQGLLKSQNPDGTMNAGNLESPPDTAFLIELLTCGAYILQKKNSPELATLNTEIKKFIVNAGESLVTGGVHTPNHRWVICSALSKINELYPNKKYIDRINEWLAEGIYNDVEGQYPERSRNYSDVENNSMITMGRLLNMPSLFDPVRKSLTGNWYYMEPNGDLVTVDSRRQDQWSSRPMVIFYLHYRYMAIRDKSAQFAGIAKVIEQLEGFDREVISRGLFQFLANPLLQQELPAGDPPPVNYQKFFTTSQLLRIRKDDNTATLFGGADWPIIIASGRSNSPDFFSCRKGKAILKYMRLSSQFFSMGYFYSEGIKKNGNSYVLHKKLEVPYYQPLPASKRKANGDYKLSPSIDDRFWNKMDFSNRPVSNVKTMDTTVTFNAVNGTHELLFDVKGLAGVLITIELCFYEGGKLSGVAEGDSGNYFLEQGMGKYEFGGDSIQFGPGSGTRYFVEGLEGERYSTHFGTLKTKGMHVFISGKTPFTHKLIFS